MSDLNDVSRKLFELLGERNRVMTTAESCTGGLIAKIMTDYAGSSDIFWGGFVTYSNESKSKMLSVPEDVLEDYGAVSRETVLAMSSGSIQNSGADCSVAVSGIAGPGGGTEEKPVGTVWISAALQEGLKEARCFRFDGNRRQIREAASREALLMLYKLILG